MPAPSHFLETPEYPPEDIEPPQVAPKVRQSLLIEVIQLALECPGHLVEEIIVSMSV